MDSIDNAAHQEINGKKLPIENDARHYQMLSMLCIETSTDSPDCDLDEHSTVGIEYSPPSFAHSRLVCAFQRQGA